MKIQDTQLDKYFDIDQRVSISSLAIAVGSPQSLRRKKPNAHDYGVYVPIDINHGYYCACCTPVYPKTKRQYHRKKLIEKRVGN